MTPEERKEIVDEIYRKVLLSVPSLVLYQLEFQSKVQKQMERFNAEHPELSGKKRTLGLIANAISSKNPDWDMHKVFDEAILRMKQLEQKMTETDLATVADRPGRFQELFNAVVMGE